MVKTWTKFYIFDKCFYTLLSDIYSVIFELLNQLKCPKYFSVAFIKGESVST